MGLLIFGVVLWWAAHLFKRLAPAQRAVLTDRFGDGSKGLFALTLLASVALMVIGYRAAPFDPVYQPVAGIGHLNNLLMLVAVYFFGVGSAKGLLASKIRHPMLIGFLIWAVAHLLVNGDVASLILFGGLGAWSIVAMVAINAREGAWTAPEPGPVQKDLFGIIITLVIFAAIAGVHTWLGKNPFLGTYG